MEILERPEQRLESVFSTEDTINAENFGLEETVSSAYSKFDPDLEGTARAMHEAWLDGNSMNSLANDLNVSRYRIKNILDYARRAEEEGGLGLRNKKINDSDVDILREIYQKKPRRNFKYRTTDAVLEEFRECTGLDISKSTMYRMLGSTERRRKRKSAPQFKGNLSEVVVAAVSKHQNREYQNIDEVVGIADEWLRYDDDLPYSQKVSILTQEIEKIWESTNNLEFLVYAARLATWDESTISYGVRLAAKAINHNQGDYVKLLEELATSFKGQMGKVVELAMEEAENRGIVEAIGTSYLLSSDGETLSSNTRTLSHIYENLHESSKNLSYLKTAAGYAHTESTDTQGSRDREWFNRSVRLYSQFVGHGGDMSEIPTEIYRILEPVWKKQEENSAGNGMNNGYESRDKGGYTDQDVAKHSCTLGFDSDVPFDEKGVRTAFRKKSLEYHPDRNKNPLSGEWFRAVKEAYEFFTNVYFKDTHNRPLAGAFG